MSLDGKGRVTVPARHRDLLAAVCANQLTLTKHPDGCLSIFPRPAWERFRERLLALPVSGESWRRVFIGSATDVEVDSGARILVAPELRAFAKLDKDVLLMGVGARLELWDAATYAAREAATMASPLPASLQDFVF